MPVTFLTAVAFILISTCFLIRHRSDLAFYHGQIGLTMYSPTFTNRPVYHWLKIVDNWRFWNGYFFGMGFLYCGIFLLTLAFCTAMLKECSSARAFASKCDGWVCLAVSVVAVIIRALTMAALRRNNPNNPLPLEDEFAADIQD